MRWRNGKGKHTISLLRVLETCGTQHVMQDVLSREFLTYRIFTAMVWELEREMRIAQKLAMESETGA